METSIITVSEPGLHSIVVMILVGVALVLFASERIPLASTSLLILVSLSLLFELVPYVGEAGRLRASHLLTGFGHQALIAVCSLMIAGQALVRTGALEPIGRELARLWVVSPKLSFLATLLIAAVLSAFVNLPLKDKKYYSIL